MTRFMTAACVLLFGMVAGPFAVADDGTYQFILSGPAENKSYSAASPGTALVTATRFVPTAAQALEARFRTWDESDGIALRSDKCRATMILFR